MSQVAKLDYARLLTRFRAARHAWKRAAMLSGAVVVVIEGLGAFTLAILANVLFAPSLLGRVALLIAATAAALFFAVRHVLRPLTRRISNKQLALYLEERNPQFEGALIAAAEFGPNDSFQGRQAQIIESILHEAAKRAEKFDLRKAVDLTRFHKYGMLAAALVLVYAVAGILMHDRFARVIAPWRPTAEEVNAATKTQPVRFALSRGDGDILRGSTFDLEAVLSRQSADEVVFHFRPLTDRSADTSFKTLAMKELEKLNTYRGLLPDVNEGFEYFVSSGPYKSEPHRIGVFDPLVIKSVETTTKFPAYMRSADRIETSDQADVAAPVGSTVSVRFVTNRPLQAGDLLWEKGNPTHGTIDPLHKEALSASFPVKDTTTFQYTLKDVAGQVFTSRAATLTAVVDLPPTIKMLKPGPSFSGNPLSEIAFLGAVADDFGLDSGDIVVVRSVDGVVKEQRFPLAFDTKLTQNVVTAAKASATLALENLTPKIEPGEVLVCHIEVRDSKGQPAFSDLTMIDVTPFESWAYFLEEKMHPHAVHQSYFLEPVITSTWRLQSSKNEFAPREFNKQADAIAATMVDPDSGETVPYFSPLHKSPIQIVHGEKAMKLAGIAHDHLAKHDTPAALITLQMALAELKLSGYTEMVVMHQPPTEPPAAAAQATFQAEMKHMTALMQQTPTTGAANGGKKEAHPEDDAAAMAAKAEALREAQAQIVEKLKQAIAQQPAGVSKAAQNTAGKQAEIANQTEDLAKALGKSGGDEEKKQATNDLGAAAQAMNEAAAPMKAGSASEALSKAQAALQLMSSAVGKLNANSQDRINQLLAQAAALAQELHRKQGDLLKQAQADPKDAELKLLAESQVQLTTGIPKLNEMLDSLQKIAAMGALKLETTKHIDEAVLAIKRTRVQQQMTDAAVELAAKNATNAIPHQSKAVEALAHIKEELMAADNARASDLATALAQAKSQAQALKDKLGKLGAQPESQPAAQTQAKGDAPAKTGQAPATQAKADAPAKTGEHPGAQAKGDGKLSGQQRKDLADKAADDAARLARQLAARDFAKGDQAFAQDINTLQQMVQDPAKMRADLTKKPEAERLASVTARLSDKLEAAYEADLQARKLFAAQREECPPQYRHLVNAYFEALSKQAK